MKEPEESAARSEQDARVEDMPSAGSIPAATESLNIEGLAKVAASTALLMYITGLFAVNTYLFRLGASDFTLVRTRFIYTGTLIWVSLLIPNVAVLISIFIRRGVLGLSVETLSYRDRIEIRVFPLLRLARAWA